MAKEFRCKKCNRYLGEMSKGKLKKDAIVLCTECMKKIEILENLQNFKDSTAHSRGTEGLGDLFKGAGFDNMFGKK